MYTTNLEMAPQVRLLSVKTNKIQISHASGVILGMAMSVTMSVHHFGPD